MIGIRSENLNGFDLIANNIVQGSLDNFGQGSGSNHEIALGSRLAANLGLTIGDKITIYSPSGFCYGSSRVGDIPPNSSFVFDIELLEINPE